MLSFAAIVPHPPLMFEDVGKEHSKQYASTRTAMLEVAEDLKALKIETIVLITTHGERYQSAVGIAFHDPYEAHLKDFGHMSKSHTFKPDSRVIDALQRELRRTGAQSTLTTNEALDHGAAIPLILWKEMLPGIKVVVLTPPAGSSKMISEMGATVRDIVDDSNTRIGVVCSSELSHRLSTISPGGFHPEAEAFDTKVKQALMDNSKTAIMKIPDSRLKEMDAMDIDAIRMYLGILGDTRNSPEVLSYEHPFGVGHLVMVSRL